MGLWTLIRDWWYARQRGLDMQILWPTLLRQAPTLDHAKAGFAYHAFRDPAWCVLGEDEIIRRIDELEPADG